MNLEAIQKLMNQFEDSETRELKIDDGDFHLYLSKNKKNKTMQAPVAITTKKTEVKAPESKQAASKQVKETATAVKSPLVGVVYLQAKPGQPAFVKVGDHIKKGDTICIIEAMKMMTEVKSTVTGTVKTVKVENEDLVEVDQPLIMVEED